METLDHKILKQKIIFGCLPALKRHKEQKKCQFLIIIFLLFSKKQEY